ncbi:beta-galactosidase trimerization domain-containing protein [bacterium]|nr:beta-galactosidase trimerization domain-containing protein [bacterium]
MKIWVFLIIGLFLCIIAQGYLDSARDREKSWRGWDTYQVIMWSTGDVSNFPLWIQRLKELGFTAEECFRGRDPKPFVEQGFGFYAENLVFELCFLHSRQPLYDKDFQSYITTRDKKFLIRNPCFHDPSFWEKIDRELKNMVSIYAPYRPLLYDLRDEPSIGFFANPMDYCFSPYTLQAFREWLKGIYGSLDNLNKEWETNYASWDEVQPMTTYEIKDRERKALSEGKLENYAPWADHRAFMDITFATTLDRMRRIIREIDPDTPVGIEGTQMPSAWGGYDLYLLSQSLDWVEPYDICNSREIFRSFFPRNAPIISTVFGTDYNRIRRKLWWLLLHGDKGCLVWDDEQSRCIEKEKDDMPITERGRELAKIFSEIKAVAPTIMHLQPIIDPIAIHYSQASIRAHWMFDSREDGDTWPRRFSSYERVHSRFAKARNGFVRLVEDLGFQYKFVSSEQIEKGELIKGGYKVLFLPQSVAMSNKECEEIKRFVENGGIVIADNMTATMDEHCKRLPKGQLDDLFGIKRKDVSWHPDPEGGEIILDKSGAHPISIFEKDIETTTGKAHYSAKAPAVIENKVGKGKAIYLNLDIRVYPKLRLSPPQGHSFLDLVGKLLKDNGIKPLIKVQKPDGTIADCVEVLRYKGEKEEYLAVIRNPEFGVEELKQIGYPGNEAIEKEETIQIILPRRFKVKEIITGREFGSTNRIEVELSPWMPLIFSLGR